MEDVSVKIKKKKQRLIVGHPVSESRKQSVGKVSRLGLDPL